jgi:hypothetical protein
VGPPRTDGQGRPQLRQVFDTGPVAADLVKRVVLVARWPSMSRWTPRLAELLENPRSAYHARVDVPLVDSSNGGGRSDEEEVSEVDYVRRDDSRYHGNTGHLSMSPTCVPGPPPSGCSRAELHRFREITRHAGSRRL